MSDPGLLILDTHIWLWLMEDAGKLPKEMAGAIEKGVERSGLRISIISVWELAMLESKGKVVLASEADEWVKRALTAPGISLVPLTPEIAVESTRLPGEFHGDPADRILVATARKFEASLMTMDRKILEYGKTGRVKVGG